MLPAPPVPRLGPQLETARQEHDPVFRKEPEGVPPAPAEAEIPMPSLFDGLQALLPPTGVQFSDAKEAPTLLPPTGVRLPPALLSPTGLPQASRFKKSHQHISTDGLTVEVRGIPEAWGGSDVPDFVELLGIKKNFLRYSGIVRMKDEKRHAFVSFRSTELAQQFANALKQHVASGRVGSLELGKIDERNRKRVEKSYFRVKQTTEGIRSSSKASYLTAHTFWL